MNDDEKRKYLEDYREKKKSGELFWPDAIAKDAVISLAVFVLLLGLAVFAGVPSEPPANPSDATYIPRPEWYFLWMFQLLKYFPGQLEGIAILGLGIAIAVGLFGLPLLDRNPRRHPAGRPVATAAMCAIVVGMVFLTIQAVVTTPPQAEAVDVAADAAGRVEAGGALYQELCAECHGAEGEGAEVTSSPGEFTEPLNSEDFLATRSTDTILQVISYGQPGRGMQAFGLAYGGTLTDQEMRSIVAFIQSWYEPLEEDGEDLSLIEAPSFAQNVLPLFERRCASCHSRRLKGNFSVADYDLVMTSGDNAPVVLPGDPANSILAQMLHGIETVAGGQMPPSRPLRADEIQMIERWIMQGALNN